MSRILLITLCFASCFASAADVYRWLDEHGVTQYGEKPPEGRPYTLVNTRPAVATVDSEGRVIERPPRPLPPPMGMVPPPPPPPYPTYAGAPQYAPPPPPPVRGMDFDVYRLLRRGMSEGELLLRAGQPDQETVDSGLRYAVKSLYYYPTLADPFITVVTVRGGRVSDIERTRKF